MHVSMFFSSMDQPHTYKHGYPLNRGFSRTVAFDWRIVTCSNSIIPNLTAELTTTYSTYSCYA